MGCEAFQTILKAPDTFLNAIEVVGSIYGVFNDFSYTPIANEQYFQYRDEFHIIQIEVDSRNKGKYLSYISCIFSLCHPRTVDEVFICFVEKIAAKLSRDTLIIITSEVPENLPDRFLTLEMNGFRNSVKKAIEIERTYWIYDFGAEQATLTTQEALEKFCYL